MTFGWLGMKGRGGLFGFLLSAGYGAAFMLAGRWDNFYWGAMIAPAMFAGIVFAPRALSELAQAARLPVRSPVAAEARGAKTRSEEHTSELQSLMRISYAVFCLKKKTKQHHFIIILDNIIPYFTPYNKHHKTN